MTGEAEVEINFDSEENLDALIDELPSFEDEPEGVFTRLKNTGKSMMAGTDVAPPKPDDPVMDPNDPFLATLKPLPKAEIIALSRETASDPTVFSVYEKRVDRIRMRDQIAGTLAGISLILFCVLVGTSYLTDTLMNQAALPEWMPAIPEEPRSAGLFVLGIITPIFSAVALMSACRYFFNATALGKIWHLLIAIPALMASMLGFSMAADGQAFQAFLLLTVYGIYSYVARKVLDKSA